MSKRRVDRIILLHCCDFNVKFCIFLPIFFRMNETWGKYKIAYLQSMDSVEFMEPDDSFSSEQILVSVTSKPNPDQHKDFNYLSSIEGSSNIGTTPIPEDVSNVAECSEVLPTNTNSTVESSTPIGSGMEPGQATTGDTDGMQVSIDENRPSVQNTESIDDTVTNVVTKMLDVLVESKGRDVNEIAMEPEILIQNDFPVEHMEMTEKVAEEMPVIEKMTFDDETLSKKDDKLVETESPEVDRMDFEPEIDTQTNKGMALTQEVIIETPATETSFDSTVSKENAKLPEVLIEAKGLPGDEAPVEPEIVVQNDFSGDDIEMTEKSIDEMPATEGKTSVVSRVSNEDAKVPEILDETGMLEVDDMAVQPKNVSQIDSPTIKDLFQTEEVTIKMRAPEKNTSVFSTISNADAKLLEILDETEDLQADEVAFEHQIVVQDDSPDEDMGLTKKVIEKWPATEEMTPIDSTVSDEDAKFVGIESSEVDEMAFEAEIGYQTGRGRALKQNLIDEMSTTEEETSIKSPVSNVDSKLVEIDGSEIVEMAVNTEIGRTDSSPIKDLPLVEEVTISEPVTEEKMPVDSTGLKKDAISPEILDETGSLEVEDMAVQPKNVGQIDSTTCKDLSPTEDMKMEMQAPEESTSVFGTVSNGDAKLVEIDGSEMVVETEIIRPIEDLPLAEEEIIEKPVEQEETSVVSTMLNEDAKSPETLVETKCPEVDEIIVQPSTPNKNTKLTEEMFEVITAEEETTSIDTTVSNEGGINTTSPQLLVETTTGGVKEHENDAGVNTNGEKESDSPLGVETDISTDVILTVRTESTGETASMDNVTEAMPLNIEQIDKEKTEAESVPNGQLLAPIPDDDSPQSQVPMDIEPNDVAEGVLEAIDADMNLQSINSEDLDCSMASDEQPLLGFEKFVAVQQESSDMKRKETETLSYSPFKRRKLSIEGEPKPILLNVRDLCHTKIRFCL